MNTPDRKGTSLVTVAAFPAGISGTATAEPRSASRSWWGQEVARYGFPRAALHFAFGPPKARTLRPGGYSGFIERIADPLKVGGSVALTVGALFVMAQNLIAQASDSIAHGQLPSFQVLLVLSTLFVIGLLIDVTLLTAGSRLRMHALRHEWGWAAIHLGMFVVCIGVEGMTFTYLLYETEPTLLAANVVAFIKHIPSVLFFVRAFMGPVSLSYLTVAVLPLTIQRSDVDRALSSASGSALVQVINEIVEWVRKTGITDMGQAVSISKFLLNTFRVATGGDTAKKDGELHDALRQLEQGISGALGTDFSASLIPAGAGAAGYAYSTPAPMPPTEHWPNAGVPDSTFDITFDTPAPTHAVTPPVAATGAAVDAAPVTRAPKGKPSPGSVGYTKLIQKAIRTLQSQLQAVTVDTVAAEIGEPVEIARTHIEAVIDTLAL